MQHQELELFKHLQVEQPYTDIKGAKLSSSVVRFIMNFGKFGLKRIYDDRSGMVIWSCVEPTAENIIRNKDAENILEAKWQRETDGKLFTLEGINIKD